MLVAACWNLFVVTCRWDGILVLKLIPCEVSERNDIQLISLSKLRDVSIVKTLLSGEMSTKLVDYA
jgi:hypothetical protein